MNERTITVKDLKINYKIFGQGRPLLILHGWGSKSDRWEKTAELLAEKDFFVVVPDLPGFGKSETLKEAWGMDNYVEWVKEFSESFLELNNDFILLGHSFGGAISVKFAIKYAQKVSKLFLFGAATVRKRTIKKQVLGNISKFVKIFSFLPFYALARKAFYKFVVGSYDYIKTEGVMKETFLKATENLSEHLSFVKIPTVIIWGDKDETTPLEEAHLIHKKIENSKLEIIEGGDHNAEYKLPEIFSQKVLEHVQ